MPTIHFNYECLMFIELSSCDFILNDTKDAASDSQLQRPEEVAKRQKYLNNKRHT